MLNRTETPVDEGETVRCRCFLKKRDRRWFSNQSCWTDDRLRHHKLTVLSSSVSAVSVPEKRVGPPLNCTRVPKTTWSSPAPLRLPAVAFTILYLFTKESMSSNETTIFSLLVLIRTQSFILTCTGAAMCSMVSVGGGRL